MTSCEECSQKVSRRTRCRACGMFVCADCYHHTHLFAQMRLLDQARKLTPGEQVYHTPVLGGERTGPYRIRDGPHRIPSAEDDMYRLEGKPGMVTVRALMSCEPCSKRGRL